MAFAPDYAQSGRFYIYFNDLNGDIRIEELRRSAGNPDETDPSTRRLVLTQGHRQFANHNGGQLQSARTDISTPRSATAGARATRSATRRIWARSSGRSSGSTRGRRRPLNYDAWDVVLRA